MTYRQIEYLRAVAREESIAAACKVLSISQSSVLAAIDVAEDTASTRLFHRRKGHGMTLTPAGRKFMISAQRFLAAGEEFERSINGFAEKETDVIRIGCFSPFGALIIPPVLKQYIEEHGHTEIILKEGDQVELRSWLSASEVDMIITYDIGEEFGSEITPICKFPAHALLHWNDPFVEIGSISMKEIAKKPFVLLDLPETRAYLLALFDLIATRPQIALRTRSYETVRSSVAHGHGTSILNIRPTKASPDTPDIRRVPISDKLQQPTLLVADPYGNRKPRHVRDFILTLYEYFEGLGPAGFAVSLPEHSSDLLYPRPRF
nr:LysR family transcriptional regulator [Agrobacterium sp. rho-13.3]MDX8310225.1 LysR family transcriptional regulator [Agrobacterium sp. rho-13.3]